MKKIVLFLSCILALASCRTYEKINYLQDLQTDSREKIENFSGIQIQPGDMISIVISCRNPELATMFNLPVISYQAGSEFSEMGISQRLLGYNVGLDGTIDFPVLGKLNVKGMSRQELSEFIKTKIVESELLKDPVVTVQFLNFKVAVLGEVNKPGSYEITGDKLTIFDAISMAQDLSIFGRRDRVFVIREQNSERNIYQLDLRSVELFKSPAYYLKQNDVVYVEPNRAKADQSTTNDNTMKSTSLWVSVGSFLVTIATLIINIPGIIR